MKVNIFRIKHPKVVWPIAFFVLLVLAPAILFVQQPRFLTNQLAVGNPDVFFFATTEEKVLALTVDDAPNSNLTPKILDILVANEIKATFFIIGQHAQGNEDLIARMKNEGHELGNHLVYDEASIGLSDEKFAENLLFVEKIIGPLHGQKWFRPGSGWFSPEMLKTAEKLGYRCCLGSLYPYDNMLQHPGLIHDMVMDRILPGTVLILHEGDEHREYIIPLLDSLIPALLADGYTFLTVSQLAEIDKQQSSPEI